MVIIPTSIKMIHLINHKTRSTLLHVDLSDQWTDDGKPVYFYLRRLESPIDPYAKAIVFILGPLAIKFGWITNQ